MKISSKKGHNMDNSKKISSIHFEEVDFDISNVTRVVFFTSKIVNHLIDNFDWWKRVHVTCRLVVLIFKFLLK
jgi:hypothetical protein